MWGGTHTAGKQDQAAIFGSEKNRPIIVAMITVADLAGEAMVRGFGPDSLYYRVGAVVLENPGTNGWPTLFISLGDYHASPPGRRELDESPVPTNGSGVRGFRRSASPSARSSDKIPPCSTTSSSNRSRPDSTARL
jgi:hypothetical protein